MSYGRSKDGAVLDATYSEEHTLSGRYKALEGFSGKKYKKSQEFVSSDKDSDTTSQSLTAEDVIALRRVSLSLLTTQSLLIC